MSRIEILNRLEKDGWNVLCIGKRSISAVKGSVCHVERSMAELYKVIYHPITNSKD